MFPKKLRTFSWKGKRGIEGVQYDHKQIGWPFSCLNKWPLWKWDIALELSNRICRILLKKIKIISWNLFYWVVWLIWRFLVSENSPSCSLSVCHFGKKVAIQLGIWQDIFKLSEKKASWNISSARIDLLSDGTCHLT